VITIFFSIFYWLLKVYLITCWLHLGDFYFLYDIWSIMQIKIVPFATTFSTVTFSYNFCTILQLYFQPTRSVSQSLCCNFRPHCITLIAYLLTLHTNVQCAVEACWNVNFKKNFTNFSTKFRTVTYRAKSSVSNTTTGSKWLCVSSTSSLTDDMTLD